jgi:hypothetical protein
MVGLNGLEPSTSRLSGGRSNLLSYKPVGGDNRDRTDDPLLAKQVLSQLSYTPVSSPGSLFFKVQNEPQKLNNEIFRTFDGFCRPDLGCLRTSSVLMSP